MNNMPTAPTTISFGEVLWDLLPTGKVAGGAPMNGAYHLKNLGLQASMISSVGADSLGEALLKFLQTKGVATDLVQTNPQYPTGTVDVILDAKGSPTYTITTSVAWDHIEVGTKEIELVKRADAFIYGSLAARHEVSKHALLQLLELAPFKVFDLNLRPPFYTQALLSDLLDAADLVKLSDEELEALFAKDGTPQTEHERLQRLMEQYHLKGIILTKGKDGASFLDQTASYEQPIFPITVTDTVGSGDAFMAGFLSQYLQKSSISKALQYGAAMGAIVATHAGGTPAIDKTTLEAFIAQHLMSS